MTGRSYRTGRGSTAQRTRSVTRGRGAGASTTTAVSSPGEETLALHLSLNKIDCEREVQCIPGRKWRVDFLIGENLVVEVEGGTRQIGRHQRHEGFEADCEKYNTLTAAGFSVLRFTTSMVTSGKAIETITQLVK